MNLQELQESKKTKVVKRALREHYEINIDFDSLSIDQTQKMLAKTKDLLGETRKSSTHEKQNSTTYLKLVMMEQALSDRLADLRNPAKIVVENEEVQKSQVILAAQDMVDSLQKMLEEVSKMNVEELNAVVMGMKNEFGTAEGDTFNQAVSQALTTLQSAITTAKDQVTSAVGALTGDGGMPAGGMGDDLGVDMDAEMDAEIAPIEEPAAEEPPVEEPEDIGGAGRERR